MAKAYLVEVKQNRPKAARPTNQRKAKARLIICATFGLWAALVWHFIHLASEPYLAAPDNLHFWLHLLFEGFLAIYASGTLYAIWRIIERSRR